MITEFSTSHKEGSVWGIISFRNRSGPGKFGLIDGLRIPSLSLNSLLRPVIYWGNQSIVGVGPLDSHDTRHQNQSGDKPGVVRGCFFPLTWESLTHFWPEKKRQVSNITTRKQLSNEGEYSIGDYIYTHIYTTRLCWEYFINHEISIPIKQPGFKRKGWYTPQYHITCRVFPQLLDDDVLPYVSLNMSLLCLF